MTKILAPLRDLVARNRNCVPRTVESTVPMRLLAGSLTESFARPVPSQTRKLIVLVLLSAVSTLAMPKKPDLSLDTANVKQDGLVEFSALFAGSDGLSSFPANRFNVGETGDQAYRLYVDLNSIQTITFSAFTFDAYLVDERETPAKTYKYAITGNPTGNFRDEAIRVVFHIKDANGSSGGWLYIPVYSAVKSDLLAVTAQKALFSVSVSRNNPIAIDLRNLPDTLAIQITEIVAQPRCSWCWSSITSPVTAQNPLNIDAGSSAPLEVDFLAKAVPALLHSAPIVQPDVPHDIVNLTVKYHTEPGGSEREQVIPVEVRFTPTIWALILMLVCGIVLGIAARYVCSAPL